MNKIVMVFVFVFAIFSMNACKSTHSCASIEKQQVKTPNTNIPIVIEGTT